MSEKTREYASLVANPSTTVWHWTCCFDWKSRPNR